MVDLNSVHNCIFLSYVACSSLKLLFANGNKIKQVPENLCLLPDLKVKNEEGSMPINNARLIFSYILNINIDGCIIVVAIIMSIN